VTYSEQDLLVIDWVHSRTEVMEDIFVKTGLPLRSTDEIERKLISYVQGTGDLGKTDWGKNSLLMNGCPLC